MRTLSALFTLTFLFASTATLLAADPLPSWNDGANKTAIVNFIERTTTAGGPDFVEPAARIATFDNDGTLWVEQPLYTQVMFAIDRIKELAPRHPEWKTTEPFKTLLAGDLSALARFSIKDFETLVAATHTGIDIEEFRAIVKKWLATARHPRFKRPYTELVYQPMLEVLRYFRANGYKTYIVTGGGQEFVRVFADQVYGIPPEQVIGSAARTKYEYGPQGQPLLMKVPEVLLIDDKAGKPEDINLFIGRRPLAAFGNSTGDQQMLEWTQAGGKAALMALVHHDDATREYDYGPDSKVGTFSDALMQEARKREWQVLSMKNDWRVIFPFDK